MFDLGFGVAASTGKKDLFVDWLIEWFKTSFESLVYHSCFCNIFNEKSVGSLENFHINWRVFSCENFIN